MPTINWLTKVITIPQSELQPLGGARFRLDVDEFRKALKDIEDGEEGIAFPDTHRHNTAVTLSGVTYARTFEIINGYTVTFQSTGTPYQVECVGANHNIADVKTVNDVSLIIGNAAGLIAVNTGGGGGATPAQIWQHVIESTFTAEQVMRLLASLAAGQTVGHATGPAFKSLDGTKNRITADVDEFGNRSNVQIDAS